MGKRLRRYTIATDDSLTLPEFFEKRFLDRTGTLRTLSAVITIFFIVFYVSSGLIAGAKLLEEVFDITHEEYHWPLASGASSRPPPGFLIATPAAVLVTLLTRSRTARWSTCSTG